MGRKFEFEAEKFLKMMNSNGSRTTEEPPAQSLDRETTELDILRLESKIVNRDVTCGELGPLRARSSSRDLRGRKMRFNTKEGKLFLK